jgi:pantoate--beta-alanine ligase
MKIFRTSSDMNAFSREVRRKSGRVGLVPTMGYLHQGHISLAKIAREHSDVVVLSNFVNPTQFGPNEDFEKYPRDLQHDNRLCEDAGVDAVFAPPVDEIYGKNESVRVIEDKLSTVLCGKSRPGHFRGVCTVVAKLFNIVEPDIAVFGMKDYQQLKIIEQMVRDLKFQIRIIRAPIVRETDGLAMSSRNKYLSPEERKNALAISAGIKEATRKIIAGCKDYKEIKSELALRISQSGGKVDYVEILDADSLQEFPPETPPKNILVAVAAFYGKTRLIDNVLVGR